MKAIKLTAREIKKKKFQRESDERLRKELKAHASFGRKLIPLNPKSE